MTTPESKRPAYTTTISLNAAELSFLREAIDSHIYWQLTDPSERNDGASLVDEGQNDEVDFGRVLDKKLAKAEGQIKGEESQG